MTIVSSPSKTSSPLIGTSIVVAPSGMTVTDPLVGVKSSPATAVPPTTDQLRLEMSGASAGVRVSGKRSTAPSAVALDDLGRADRDAPAAAGGRRRR